MKYQKICILFFLILGINATAIETSDFFLRSKNTGVTLSPSGNYLIQVEENTTHFNLLVTDLKTSEIIYNPKIGKGYPENIIWLNDRRIMYEQGGRLISINIDGNEHRVVFNNIHDYDGEYHSSSWFKKRHRNWKILHTLPDKKDEIITETTDINGISTAQILNIFTGEKEIIADGRKNKINSWYSDLSGNIILGASYKKNKIDLYFKQSKDKKYNNNKFSGKGTIDLSDDVKLFSQGRHSIYSDISFISGSYDPDIVYVSEAMDRDTFQLSEFNLSKQKVTKVIYSDEKYDVGNVFYTPKLHFYGPEKKLIGLTYLKDSVTSVWFDDRFTKIQSNLDKHYPNSINTIMQWSDDLSKVVVNSSRTNNRGKHYVYYPLEKRIVFQSIAEYYLPENTIGSTQTVHYQSEDGVSHEGYLTLPNNVENITNLPVVIFVHGGPWSRYHLNYDPEVAFFSSKGYAVLRVNYRGSEGFGKNYLHAGIKNLSKLMIDDIATAAKWMIEQKYADPNRVFIMGSSYGGYAAFMSALRYPSLYSGIVAYASPLNFNDQFKHLKKKKRHYAYDFWKNAVGDPVKEKQQLYNQSPLTHIKNIKVPFLAFHGEDDDIVPASQMKKLKSLLKKHKLDGEAHILRNEGHGFNYISNHVYYVEKALRFFEQHGNK